jgi:hypothetical protein
MLVALLEKMRVFKADIEYCLEYISNCYSLFFRIDSQQGWAYLPWFTGKCSVGQAPSYIKRIALLFNKSAIARDGKNAVKKAWATIDMQGSLPTHPFPGKHQNAHNE